MVEALRIEGRLFATERNQANPRVWVTGTCLVAEILNKKCPGSVADMNHL